MEWTRLSYHDDDDDDDAIDPAMLQASRPLSSSSRACVSRIDILARATIRRVAVWADDPSIRQRHHLFVDRNRNRNRNRFCSVLFCSVLFWARERQKQLDRVSVGSIRLERAMDEGAFLRAYALIAEDDDTGEASSPSSSTVWVCARTRPLDDDAWVRLSSACGRFASSSSSSSSSRLACAGLDADSHDARCLIAEEASEELRENLRRMRDEEIEQSYARAEIVWAKRESGEEGRSARAALRVDLCHTYTPPERRGRGEGARVVEQLIAWARFAVKAESVVASCSFARRVLDEGG